MKVQIKNALFSEGAYSGSPALFVMLDDAAEDKTHHEVLEEIVQSGIRSVVIVARLVDNGEIIDLVRALAGSGKMRITVVTDCGDQGITSVRHLIPVRFFLKFVMPSGQENNIFPGLFQLLKERDEIKVGVEKAEDFKMIGSFLNTKQIVNPTILFNVDNLPEEEKEAFYTEIWKEENPFNFKYRITKSFNA